MKTKVMNQSDRDALLVERFSLEADKRNKRRNVRINELNRIATSIESVHGDIIKLDKISRKLKDSMVHSYDPKRDSWGYKETGKLLDKAIAEIRNFS